MVNPEAGVSAPATAAGRRRRRRWPWITGIVVVVLFALLVVADRITVSMAESAVADRIAGQPPFAGSGVSPHVSINGFPFLTQAVAGTYDDIEVSGKGLTIDQVSGIALDVRMHGVHVPLHNAIDRHVDALPIDHLNAVATVPYAEAAQRTGIEGLQLSDNNGTLHVTLSASVAPLGDLTASADADLHVSGNRVAYTVRQITVNGAPVPAALAPHLQQMMNGELALPTLPYHLHVTGVTLTPSGIQATAEADHIVVDTS
jgi:LmeA-like phospholipid-binding